MQEKLPPSRGGTLKAMINKFKTQQTQLGEEKSIVCSIGSSPSVAPPPEPG